MEKPQRDFRRKISSAAALPVVSSMFKVDAETARKGDPEVPRAEAIFRKRDRVLLLPRVHGTYRPAHRQPARTGFPQWGSAAAT